MSLSIENFFAILVSSVKKFWHSGLSGVSISIPSRGKDSSELDRSNDKDSWELLWGYDQRKNRLKEMVPFVLLEL